MPLRRDRAFVLSAIPLKERDRIVSLLTERSGRRRAVARGARRLRSPVTGSLEPMTEAHVVYFEKEGAELVRLDSLSVVRSSFPLAGRLDAALLLSAIAETLETFVPDADPSEKFFRLAAHAMSALFSGVSARTVAAYVDVWVLHLSGIFPEASACGACGAMLPLPAAFDPEGPSFLCASCGRGRGARLTARLGPALRQILSRRLPDVALTEAELAEISAVAASVRRRFLGHELKSWRVLAQTWPGGLAVLNSRA